MAEKVDTWISIPHHLPAWDNVCFGLEGWDLKGWVIATDSGVAMGRCKVKKGVEEWVKIEVKFVWQACNVLSIQNLNRAACVEIRGGKLSLHDSWNML